MSTPSEKNNHSLRHFPPDLLMALGVPIVVTMLAVSWVLSLHGSAWLWAAAASFGIAMLGAALIFVAKLPLYRQRRFFTFGIHALPQSSHGYYRWGLPMRDCRLRADAAFIDEVDDRAGADNLD